MFSFPETPVFTSSERAGFETDEYVRPYAAITKNQLAGLLHAFGEYACRHPATRPYFIEMASNDSELAERNNALVGCWRRLRKGYLSYVSDTASSDQLVFDAEERRSLSKMKYIHGCEHLSKAELAGILDALGRYSLRAPVIQQVPRSHKAYIRLVHARNALLSFRDRPFTFRDFVQSYSAVMAGTNSRPTL
jgi:hypothetical protein